MHAGLVRRVLKQGIHKKKITCNFHFQILMQYTKVTVCDIYVSFSVIIVGILISATSLSVSRKFKCSISDCFSH